MLGLKSKKGLDEDWGFSGGREREPESRGGRATLPPDGAEAAVVILNRADAATNDRTDFRGHVPVFFCPVIKGSPPETAGGQHRVC